MFTRKTSLVSIGIFLLSGMFLMGQDSWFPPVEKIVFVTDSSYNGDLGGLAGADAICQAEAEAAGLGGTYKAWLSDIDDSPSTRFNQPELPYRLVDGTLVASGWSDLIVAITNPIYLSATGQLINDRVWTNTWFDGTSGENENPTFTCNNWTTDSPDSGAVIGDSTRTDRWTWDWVASCDYDFRLYCFQQ